MNVNRFTISFLCDMLNSDFSFILFCKKAGDIVKFKKVMNIVAGTLFFLGVLPYLWGIITTNIDPSPLVEKIAPSAVTWIIWASVDTLALIAMIRKKAKNIGQLAGATVGAWSIFLLTLFFGKISMGLIEWICIAGALTGIILWKIKGDALFGVVCSQLTMIIGSIPTFVGAYYNPGQEDQLAWALWFASCLFGLLAVEKWEISKIMQPLTFTFIETVVVALIIVRPMLA